MIRCMDTNNCNKKAKKLSKIYNISQGDIKQIADTHLYAFAKILLCCKDPDDQNIYAVCLCCKFKHHESSTFTTHWEIEYYDKSYKKPYIAYIHVSSCARHVMMIPENDNLHIYHEIWETSEWSKAFL